MSNDGDLKDFALCSFSIGGGAPSGGLAIDGQVIALRALVEADHPDAPLFVAGTVFEMLQAWDKAWPMPLVRTAKYGGYEADWMTFLDMVAEAGRVAGSIGSCMPCPITSPSMQERVIRTSEGNF